MLRRSPTVLTLTSEDLKAYEDRREALIISKQRQQHHHHQHHHQHQTPLAAHISRSSSSSSGYEDVSDSTLHRHHPRSESEDEDEDEDEEEVEEEEDSYYPRRYRTIEDPNEDVGAEIFLNEVDVPDMPSDPFASSSSGGSLVSAVNHHRNVNNDNGSNAQEDQVMAELAPEDFPEARQQADIIRNSSAHPPSVSRFGRRAAAAVTPTAGGRGSGGGGAGEMVTPEAPVRQTRSREERTERILGRGGRR